MSHAKQASTKRKRSINAVPVLSIAGLSTSLASGASAAIGRPAADLLTPKTGMSHEITLLKRRFLTWRKTCAGRLRLRQLRCEHLFWSRALGSYVTPPRYSKPTRKRRAGA